VEVDGKQAILHCVLGIEAYIMDAHVHTVSQKKLTDNCSTLLSMSLQYTDNVVAFGWLHLITRSASMYLQFFFCSNQQSSICQRYNAWCTRRDSMGTRYQNPRKTGAKILSSDGRPRTLKMCGYGDSCSWKKNSNRGNHSHADRP